MRKIHQAEERHFSTSERGTIHQLQTFKTRRDAVNIYQATHTEMLKWQQEDKLESTRIKQQTREEDTLSLQLFTLALGDIFLNKMGKFVCNIVLQSCFQSAK